MWMWNAEKTEVWVELVCLFTSLTFPPPWSLKRRCFWFAETLRWTFRWAGDCRELLFKSLLGRDLWLKFPLDNDSPPSNYKKKKDHRILKQKNVYANNIYSWFSNLSQVIQGVIRTEKKKKMFGYRTESWQTGREGSGYNVLPSVHMKFRYFVQMALEPQFSQNTK